MVLIFLVEVVVARTGPIDTERLPSDTRVCPSTDFVSGLSHLVGTHGVRGVRRRQLSESISDGSNAPRFIVRPALVAHQIRSVCTLQGVLEQFNVTRLQRRS